MVLLLDRFGVVIDAGSLRWTLPEANGPRARRIPPAPWPRASVPREPRTFGVAAAAAP